MAAFVGVALHFFANSEHTLRLMGCPPPMLLIGALGLNEVWKLQISPSPNKRVPLLAGVFLMGFLAWSARAAFARVYEQWADVPPGMITAYTQTRKDLEMGYQVYWDPEMCGIDYVLLFKDRQVHYWDKVKDNRIYLGPHEKASDAVLYSKDGTFLRSVEKAFPQAQLAELHEAYDPQQVTTLRLQIPFGSFADPKQKWIRVFRVKTPYWHRTFGCFTMDSGFLGADDKTANAYEAPANIGLANDMVRYQGTIHLGQSGVYEIECKTYNRARVLFDGQSLIDLYTPMTDGFYHPPATSGTRSLFLGPGEHQVEVDTCFQQGYEPPQVTLKLKGSVGPGRSLWSGFDF